MPVQHLKKQVVSCDLDGTLSFISEDRLKVRDEPALYLDPKLLLLDKPKPFMIERIQMLATNHTIIINTARPKTLKKITEAWLNRYLPNVKYRLCMRESFNQINLAENIQRQLANLKLAVVKKSRADVHFDDNKEQLVRLKTLIPSLICYLVTDKEITELKLNGSNLRV